MTIDLDQLESAVAAMTLAPWHQGPYYRSDVHSPNQGSGRDAIVKGSSICPADIRDAAGIVALRNAASELIRMARRAVELEREIDAARKQGS